MPDWEKIIKLYESVKAAKQNGLTTKAEAKGVKVYSMGENNPVIRIDIKET